MTEKNPQVTSYYNEIPVDRLSTSLDASVSHFLDLQALILTPYKTRTKVFLPFPQNIPGMIFWMRGTLLKTLSKNKMLLLELCFLLEPMEMNIKMKN